jgi:hypothetical protein
MKSVTFSPEGDLDVLWPFLVPVQQERLDRRGGGYRATYDPIFERVRV